MANPIVSSVSAVQGTGQNVLQSVIEVTYTLASENGNPCNVTAELSNDDGGTWYACVMNSHANGQNVAAGSARLLTIDTNNTFSQSGFFARANEALRVRVKATDTVTSEVSAWEAGGSAFMVKSTLPAIASATMPQYIGASAALAAPLVVDAHNGDGSTDPTRIRYNAVLSQLDPGSGLSYTAWGTGEFTYVVPGATPDGPLYLYVRVYDSFYNASAAVLVDVQGLGGTRPWLQRQLPQNVRMLVTSPNGDNLFAGIKINDNGSFTPNRQVTLQVGATSPIPLQFKIMPSSQVQTADNVNVALPLNADNAVQTLYLTTNTAAPSSDDYNQDVTTVINVDFIDAAGNTRSESTAVRLNTRIYKTAQRPLRRPDTNYDHLIREVTTGGAENVIARNTTLSGDPIRAWPDIFYPTTHGYPKDIDGTLNEAEALTMDNTSNANFDAPLVSNGQPVLDSEGRPIITDWSYDKLYGHMLSSNLNNLVYWVVDNSAYGEFQLDFEYFDLDANHYGPPFNPVSPYRGDVLVVYDATAPGALEEVVTQTGDIELRIADSSKLVEMFAFTGAGSNVTNLTTGLRMGSSPTGAFSSPAIRGIPRVALILYTDAAAAKSGFRLKSGPAHDRVWRNFDVDEVNGEIWIHKHSSLGTVNGAADSTAKRAVYDYLDQDVSINYQSGEVAFQVPPSGEVTADYSYIGTIPDDTDLYLASHDDFVDYAPVATYVLPSGEATLSDAARAAVFEVDGYGLMTTGAAWDKDRGLLQVSDPEDVVGRRLAADYQHHTFYRLSSDGHGDLTFYDPIVVADDTPVYPDYTWADVRIVNEGDATLEDGKLKFVARGYDTNNDGEVIINSEDTIVDQVLDVNRPWDIQKGTRAETFDKMAVEIRDAFTWAPSLSKADAAAILGTWKDKVFGDIPARGQIYGRAVWVLGGPGGSAYPDATSGSKRTSFEVSGKFYSSIVLV